MAKHNLLFNSKGLDIIVTSSDQKEDQININYGADGNANIVFGKTINTEALSEIFDKVDKSYVKITKDSIIISHEDAFINLTKDSTTVGFDKSVVKIDKSNILLKSENVTIDCGNTLTFKADSIKSSSNNFDIKTKSSFDVNSNVSLSMKSGATAELKSSLVKIG